MGAPILGKRKEIIRKNSSLCVDFECVLTSFIALNFQGS